MLFACVFLRFATGQNLVMNPGFENYSQVPNNYGQICRAQSWISPSGACSQVIGCGTPDFYHTAGNNGANPPNTFWATANTHTGAGMAGFAPWYVGSPNFREYVMVPLANPLVMGETYEIGCWLSNGNSMIHPYGISKLGFAFSDSAFTQTCGAPIAATPQYEVPAILFSVGWQYVSFTYTAEGPYQYLCIGNFQSFVNTVSQKIGVNGNAGAYYFIDDVVVQNITPLPVELIAFDAQLQEDRSVLCSWITASETNSDHFELQRSADGERFEPFAIVAAAGNSVQEIHYAQNDPDPLPGLSYYRLIQVDRDGARVDEGTRAVWVPVTDELQVVAASGAIEVQWAATHTGSGVVEVMDVRGRLVAQRSLARGERWSFAGLEAGVYLVRAADGSSPAQDVVLMH